MASPGRAWPCAPPGLERSEVAEAAAHERPKSVSNERTFSQDLTSRDELEAAVLHVSDMVARRLRKKGLKGRTVTLKLKFDVSHTRTAQRALAHETSDAHVIGPFALSLLDELWHEGVPVRLVGVGVSGFDGGEEQLALFAMTRRPSAAPRASPRSSACATPCGIATGTMRSAMVETCVFSDRTSDTAPMNKSDF